VPHIGIESLETFNSLELGHANATAVLLCMCIVYSDSESELSTSPSVVYEAVSGLEHCVSSPSCRASHAQAAVHG
jgi:hypothetical protein